MRLQALTRNPDRQPDCRRDAPRERDSGEHQGGHYREHCHAPKAWFSLPSHVVNFPHRAGVTLPGAAIDASGTSLDRSANPPRTTRGLEPRTRSARVDQAPDLLPPRRTLATFLQHGASYVVFAVARSLARPCAENPR